MKITLSHIAEKAGVTISTAQRALNGGKGVSDSKRDCIIKIANELEYKKKPGAVVEKKILRLAVVFPDIRQDNRFFTPHLWFGLEHFKKICTSHSIEFVHLTYQRLDEHIQRIQEIADGEHGILDGVIARGTVSPESSKQFRKLQKNGIPVVLVGADIASSFRLCCVENYAKLTGAMVADLFINFGVLKDRSQAILCGTFVGLNQFYNAQGFERQTWNAGLNIDMIKIPEAENNIDTKQSICAILENNENVSAIYACSARSTIAAHEAIAQMGMENAVRLVGSDLFTESIQLLRLGKIAALVHNHPFTLAYTSIETLVSYLSNGKKPEKDTVLISSDIVTRGNLDFFLSQTPSLKELCDPAQLTMFS